MDIWLPGVLSLIGALLGVGMANYLSDRTQQRQDRQQRPDDAVRALALARAAGQFSYSIGVDGVPDSIQACDRADIAKQLWLGGIERYFVRLREAREAVAALTIDGNDLAHY